MMFYFPGPPYSIGGDCPDRNPTKLGATSETRAPAEHHQTNPVNFYYDIANTGLISYIIFLPNYRCEMLKMEFD